MFTINKFLIVATILVALTSFASAFFWGASETPAPPVQYFYQKRLLQGGPAPYSASESSEAVPSIPIQMPLQAQFAPAPNVHNVQLVPCLCPVSQDLDYEKIAPPETVYVNANVQHQGSPTQ